MLIELAIGDAYGAGFEYASNKIVRENNFGEQYIQHQRHTTILPGQYTDDAQMAIAVAEALIAEQHWNETILAGYFLNAFKRDQREGYAKGFYDFLCSVETAEEFLERIKPDSEKSGAAMRASPIGVLADEKQVIEYCALQAKLTHNTPLGVNAALAAALMTHYFIYDLGPKQDLGEYIASKVSGDWNVPWKGKVGALGVDSTRAAITAVIAENDLKSILLKCIAYTGDTDTVATIALAAAACSKEVDKNLSQSLYDNLERGAYGYDYIARLDKELMARVK
ncbi:ADP-ribosylglycohydrolase family protein [Hahella sp. KA22]|uniref:ADP-ribosylglycohydrolase family protein n=1 Tax=Hahella sp. KA22 TaxID=1628392 RepID=UPI000FDECE4E|nr:ADP-ribosylglycohydrolase family protein [Hahella sp. KA22]AZZ91975.1 ADP-ribosylglycohydrolase family protein [Hahella sp. KA22]QAY55346.1 ADP-ribosylglycohydrolase family protein [Hahella sp. KA22]